MRAILRAERHLHRPTPDPALHHALSHLVQSRARFHLTSVPALGIFSTAPQDLCRSRRSGPEIVVEIHWIGLLAPHVHFAAEDKMGRVGRYAGKWIVGVYKPPVVEGIAVVGERVVLGGFRGVKVKPLAVAAVKVLGLC